MGNDQFPNEVPDIALPDLKKKKKERKKGGVAWGSGGNAAEAFEGATGGLGRGAASAAAEAAGELAASEGGGLIARALSALSEFGATLVGKLVLTLGAAALIGSAAVIASRLMGQSQAAKNGAADLGGIASNIKVRADDDSGLSKVRGNGELKFDGGKSANAGAQDQAKNGGEQGQPGEDGKPGEPPADGKDGDAGSPFQDRLAHNLSGAKLSDSLGGSMGSGSAIAGGKVGAGIQKQDPLGFGKSGNDKGKAAALQRANMSGSRSLNLGRRGIRSNRALGQLRSMAPLGGQMTTAATAEEAAQTGTTQFEGATPAGAQAPTAPGSLTGTTPNPTTLGGPSGPPCTSDDPNACGITTPGHTDGTDAITQMVKAAHDQISSAITMLYIASAAALAMEILGFVWLNSCCSFIAFVFFAIAALIAAVCIAICYMMGSAVKQMADQIKQAGAHLGTDGGESPQANAVADQVKQMGEDIMSGSLQTLIAGIGGVLAAQKVSAENDALQQLADSIESSGVNGGSGTPTTP